MKTMLWKEWREKRLWAIPLLLSTAGLVALGKSYTFSGDLTTFSRWTWVSFLVSLLFGMGAYSRDLTAGIMDFMCSKPVSWKRMLLAKLTVGLGTITACTLFSAILYRLTCPVEYAHLATFGRLASGVAMAVSLMGISYVLGAACSVPVPGYVGSLLVLAALAMLVGAPGYVTPQIRLALDAVAGGGSSSTPPEVVHRAYEAVSPFWWAFGLVVGLVISSLVTIRFGLTLSARSRFPRYCAIALLIAVAAAPLDYITPTPFWVKWFYPLPVQCTFSPTGEYAVWTEPLAAPGSGWRPLAGIGTKAHWLMRLSDGKRARIDALSLMEDFPRFVWVTPDTLAFTEQVPLDKNGEPLSPGRAAEEFQYAGVTRIGLLIHRIRMDRSGKLVETSLWAGKMNDGWVGAEPSPNNRFLMVSIQLRREDEAGLERHVVEFWDLLHMRKVGPKLSIPGGSPRWVSDSEIEYTDRNRQQHTVRIGDLKVSVP